MIKVRIVDWGNDPLLEEFEDIVEDYDGEIVRVPSITIQVSHQHSVYVEEV